MITGKDFEAGGKGAVSDGGKGETGDTGETGGNGVGK